MSLAAMPTATAPARPEWAYANAFAPWFGVHPNTIPRVASAGRVRVLRLPGCGRVKYNVADMAKLKEQCIAVLGKSPDDGNANGPTEA